MPYALAWYGTREATAMMGAGTRDLESLNNLSLGGGSLRSLAANLVILDKVVQSRQNLRDKIE
jgi:hypothetical protein